MFPLLLLSIQPLLPVMSLLLRLSLLLFLHQPHYCHYCHYCNYRHCIYFSHFRHYCVHVFFTSILFFFSWKPQFVCSYLLIIKHKSLPCRVAPRPWLAFQAKAMVKKGLLYKHCCHSLFESLIESSSSSPTFTAPPNLPSKKLCKQ